MPLLRKSRLPFAFFAAAFALAGCGGGGAAAADPDAARVTLSASRSVIEPGEAVTLTWSSRNASEVVSSNLGTSNVGGTLSVSPTFTSDYTITVAGTTTHTATVRVTVDRPRPRFAVVGDPADPEVPQIRSALQSAGEVAASTSLPASSTYDALVIHGSANVGPGDAAAVRAALEAGKGVVLVGFAPTRLASGRASFTDDGSASDDVLSTAPIASWFGGVTEVRRDGGSYWFRAGVDLSFFALPAAVSPAEDATHFGDGDDARLPIVERGRVGAGAYRTLSTVNDAAAFAFRPPTGGRLAWQWHSSGFDAESQAKVAALFRTTCLWAASE